MMQRLRSIVISALAVGALLGLLPGGAGASGALADNSAQNSAQTGAQASALPAHTAARPPRAALDAWQPEADDQWLFELRTARLRIGNGIRGYVSGTRVCVNLGDVITTLDLPIRVDTQLRRATGWAFDERHTLVIDRDAGQIVVASRALPLGLDAIVDTPEGWCVDPVQLGAWLGVTLTADTANSVLRLDSERSLPFELAAQRRARAAAIRPAGAFNLADLPQARQPYAMWAMPSVDVVASAAVIRDATTNRTTQQVRYELFASGEALGASFDARLSSDTRGRPESVRLRAYRSDPAAMLLGPLHATHVGIGDVSGLASPLASQPVAGRGAVITNRPLDLPDSFDRITLRGDLPDGWDAELYRNGQLLGFATPDGNGRYQFTDVQLLYGQNRLEVVLYGPQGQERRDVRTIPVGIDAIPPQKTYYWAGVVQEGQDLLPLRRDDRPYPRGWRAMLGLERGLNRRTSIGAWATTLMIENTRYTMVDASLRRSIGPTLAEISTSVQSGGGYAGRLFWVGQLGNSFFQIESLLGRNGYRSDRITQGVTGLHSISLDQSVRLGTNVLPVQFAARYRQRSDGQDRLEGSARVSANWRNLTLTGQFDWLHSRALPNSGRGAVDDVIATFLANARFGAIRLRGEAQIGVSGPSANTRFAAVAEWNSGERGQWRAEAGYDATARRARLGGGYTRRFDRLALSGYGEVATDGSLAAGLNLSFAFGPDPRNGGVRFSSERLASQGQAMATVFIDDNGDGVRQPGEELAPGVTLTAGTALAATPTDAHGQAIIEALAPFRQVMIGIDESSLSSPLIRPSLPGVVITPRPGMATRILLPLTAAGEVEGILVRSGGGSGIEGVDLELIDARGVVRAVTRSDFDGFFLFESVAYGQYRVRIAALSAQAIGADSDLAAALLNRENPRVRLGVLAISARANVARPPPTAIVANR